MLCICTVHIYVWELGQYMCVCIHMPKGLLVSGHPDMLLGKFGHLSANSLHQFQCQIEGQVQVSSGVHCSVTVSLCTSLRAVSLCALCVLCVCVGTNISCVCVQGVFLELKAKFESGAIEVSDSEEEGEGEGEGELDSAASDDDDGKVMQWKSLVCTVCILCAYSMCA